MARLHAELIGRVVVVGVLCENVLNELVHLLVRNAQLEVGTLVTDVKLCNVNLFIQ